MVDNTSLETILKLFDLPYLTWTDVTEVLQARNNPK